MTRDETEKATGNSRKRRHSVYLNSEDLTTGATSDSTAPAPAAPDARPRLTSDPADTAGHRDARRRHRAAEAQRNRAPQAARAPGPSMTQRADKAKRMPAAHRRKSTRKETRSRERSEEGTGEKKNEEEKGKG
ncbi:unnamed protein product [Boreogadus saida]